MTFLQLYGEGLNIELGSDDTTQLFTNVRRKAAVNAGQLEFIKRTGCFRRVASITLAHNTREYNLASAAVLAATDFLRVWDDGVEYVFTSGGTTSYRSGDDFPKKDVGWLNRNHAGWRVASASQYPQFWYQRHDEGAGANYLGLSEPPSITGSNTATITLPYVARSTDMVVDGAVPFANGATASVTILEPFHQACAHFGASVLERLRKNYDGVQAQLALFAGYVADYLQQQNPTDGEQIFVAHDYRAAAGRMPLSRAQRDPLIY